MEAGTDSRSEIDRLTRRVNDLERQMSSLVLGLRESAKDRTQVLYLVLSVMVIFSFVLFVGGLISLRVG